MAERHTALTQPVSLPLAMPMKRAQSTGALSVAASARSGWIDGSATPIQLGWAQTENMAKLGTAPGRPDMGPGLRRRPSHPKIEVDLSPKAQQMESNLPELLPFLQMKLHGPCCSVTGGGWLRLTVSCGTAVLSWALIYHLPGYMMPACWFLCGTSLFGLNAVAVSCANNTFCELRIVNHIVGWICSAILLVPFEAWTLHSETAVWRQQEANFLKTVSSSRFWLFSSFVEWARSQVSVYVHKKRVLGNMAAMWAADAIILPLLVKWLGVWGFFNYFTAPWLVYHVFRSYAIKVKFSRNESDGMDQASVVSLLAAFTDEFPDEKLSVPVVSKLLGEANRTVDGKRRWMDRIFGWETFQSFPYAAVGVLNDPSIPTPRLVQRAARTAPTRRSSVSSVYLDEDTGLFAQFGGQGVDYFDELLNVFKNVASKTGSDGRPCLARRLIDEAADALQRAVASPEAAVLGLHDRGLSLMTWLTTEDMGQRPPGTYLRSAPVSYPLIGLTQLVNYAATLDRLEATAGEFRGRLKGATGHSQGVASAVVVACSRNEEELVQNGRDMVEYLFWHGTRMQQVANEEVLKGTAVQPAGATELTHPPTPMLAVLGLPVELVAQLLERAALSNKVQLSLVNGNTAVVLSGEPATLAVLEQKLNQQQLQDMNTPRSAVPFYKRRPVVTTRFLRVTAPFHFSRMDRAEKLIMADVARIGLRISGDRLAIPVYATDGHARDIAQTCGSSDIMPTLVSMQATRTVQWPAAVANASARNSVTHVLDFGPGGARGSARLTRMVLADRMEDLPVILASPYQAADDSAEGVFGLDTLMSDTAAHEGAKAHWAAAISKTKAVRRIASAPVLSVASRAGGMRKGQLGSRERKLHELDATKVSVNEFKKLSKSPQATSFRDRQVTFVTD